MIMVHDAATTYLKPGVARFISHTVYCDMPLPLPELWPPMPEVVVKWTKTQSSDGGTTQRA